MFEEAEIELPCLLQADIKSSQVPALMLRKKKQTRVTFSIWPHEDECHSATVVLDPITKAECHDIDFVISDSEKTRKTAGVTGTPPPRSETKWIVLLVTSSYFEIKDWRNIFKHLGHCLLCIHLTLTLTTATWAPQSYVSMATGAIY